MEEGMSLPSHAALSTVFDANPRARSLWCLAAAAIIQCALLVYLPTSPYRVSLAIALIGVGLAIGAAMLLVRRLPGAGLTAKALVALTALGMTAFPWRSRAVRRLVGADPSDWLVWGLAGAVIAIAGYALWRGSPRVKTAALLVLASVFVYRGHYAIQHVDETEFDVIASHHAAYRKLLTGGNPYSPPTPFNISLEEGRKIYPAARIKEGYIDAGYVYPPLLLLTAMPSYLVTHDIRYGILLEILLAAWLLTRLAPGDSGRLAAAVLLTNPFAVEVASLGWTEPAIILLFLCFLWCWRRWPAQAGWLLGGLVSIKQTMVMWAPLAAALLWGRFTAWPERLRWTARAATTAAVPLLAALALWGFEPMFDSTVRLHADMPARGDSLTFIRFAADHPPAWLNLISLAGVAGFLGFLAFGFRRNWTASLPHWVALAALCWTTFFYFNRQAFGNYYYFTICLWLTAAAMLDTAAEDRTTT